MWIRFLSVSRDVSGFVRLFYILSKNKIFRIFGRHILDFWSIICRFLWIYRTFSVKNLFFVKIKNKRTKPDTSQFVSTVHWLWMLYALSKTTHTLPKGKFTWSLGRIRFCALILDFNKKSIFNKRFTINSLKTWYYSLKIKNMFPKNAKNLDFWQNIE